MEMTRSSLRQISWVLGGSLLLCGLFWLWLTVQQQESTLAIRPVSQGISMPDGFPSGTISTLTVSVLKALRRRMTVCLSSLTQRSGAAAKKFWAALYRMVILSL